MPKSTELRIAELIRFIEWINQNPNTWNYVIGVLSEERALNDETYIDIFRQLKEKQFYQILFMLFQATDNYYIKDAVSNSAMLTISKHIDKNGLDDFIELVIEGFNRVKRNIK